MKPETRSVTQLFGLDVRYVGPLCRRPYVREQWQRDRLAAAILGCRGVRIIRKGVSCGTRTVGV